MGVQRMSALVKKAFVIARTRPLQFLASLRQYALFARTGWLGRWVFTADNGIELADNVRVQRLSCLSAERPDARVRVGADSVVYEHARIEAYGRGEISVGEGSIIGDARICSRSSIRIGRRVVTSWNVFIQDFDPHPIEPELRAIQMRRMTGGFKPSSKLTSELPSLAWDFPVAPVTIGDDVWIGANATILKGARIGDGCVVATGAVVTKGDYPARSILAGSPAKVVKSL